MLWLMVVLFFASGATALVGEVVWMRMLGLVLGNTVWAATAAVAVWMGGMAVGAALGARLAPRTRHHLRWYGLAEGAIGLFYAFSPRLHPLLLDLGALLGPDLGGNLLLGVAKRFALAALVLLPPTVLMGLTLPLVVERLRGDRIAARVSVLYGVNTLGAAAGVFLTAYLLLPVLGERAALGVTSLACAIVMATALIADGRCPAATEARAEAAASSPRSYLLLVAVMGFAALAAELVWVRVLVLHLGSRVYAFAILLGVYLLGIALGSLLVRGLADRISRPAHVLAALQAALGLALGLQVLALGHAGGLLYLGARLSSGSITFGGLQAILLLTVAVLFLPVTVLFGASFPLAAAAHPGRLSAGTHTGRVGAANTIGGIFGALLGPLVLVPAIGCQRTLLLIALAHVAVGLCLVRSRLVVAATSLGACLVLCLWLVLPSDWVLRRAADPTDERVSLVALEEGLSATVLVKRYQEADRTWLSLELNGVNVAGSDPALLAIQQLQGQVPLLQAESAKRVLHIGFGSGGTCWAVSRHPVERIVVAEIAPEVLSSADTYFPFVNHHVLADPRLQTVVNDGRNFLLATREKFDAILSDSIHPVFAGNGALYTREYFQLCRERLQPDGVVSMWLPLYSLDRDSYLRILAAFHEVFPQTAVWYDISTVNEYSVVTGRTGKGPLRMRWDAMLEAEVSRSLAIGGVHTPSDLAADLLLGPREVRLLVADVPPHEDDLPFVEYTAGRVLARQQTWYDNLVMLWAFRARSSPFVEDRFAWAEVQDRRDRRLREILHQVGKLATPAGAEGGMLPAR